MRNGWVRTFLVRLAQRAEAVPYLPHALLATFKVRTAHARGVNDRYEGALSGLYRGVAVRGDVGYLRAEGVQPEHRIG